MHKVNHSAILPFSSQQMFDLVDDIAKYNEFVPYCAATDVLERIPDQVTARVSLKKGPFSHHFTTRNENIPYEKITMNLVEGPFSRFEGIWTFTKLQDNACKVALDMEFAFDSRLLNGMFAKVFDQIANKMLDAFCKRAVVVYGEQHAN